MKMMRSMVLVAAGLSITGAPAVAMSTDSDWTGHFGIGYVFGQGRFSDAVEDDWMLTGGAVYRRHDAPVGWFIDLSWSNHDLERDVLNSLAVDDGDVDNFSLASGVQFNTPKRGKTGLYFKAGIAEHFLDVDLTEPGIVTGVVCDPWWWWCVPAAGVGDVVVESESTWRFGYNAGIGITWDLRSTQLYLEARYNWINLNETVAYLPVIFGWRW
jgi:opacity protein-like surface antigen